MDRKNVWKTYTPAQKAELDQVNERYKACLDAGKTERECVAITVEEAKKAGCPVELKQYCFYVMGQGLEKKSEDLQEEVAKQVEAMKK